MRRNFRYLVPQTTMSLIEIEKEITSWEVPFIFEGKEVKAFNIGRMIEICINFNTVMNGGKLVQKNKLSKVRKLQIHECFEKKILLELVHDN
ncbi:hypothetical protein [Flammeovirga sp. SubArs3]|uniref:hypothetical protein n=1 Tax=Flammeovirga sp. SubArs3 TaxID=2995316 RepID=UPI00248BDDC0|nr:hypothetical protein [Flammeovirga sp. SubArs3]